MRKVPENKRRYKLIMKLIKDCLQDPGANGILRDAADPKALKDLNSHINGGGTLDMAGWSTVTKAALLKKLIRDYDDGEHKFVSLKAILALEKLKEKYSKEVAEYARLYNLNPSSDEKEKKAQELESLASNEEFKEYQQQVTEILLKDLETLRDTRPSDYAVMHGFLLLCHKVAEQNEQQKPLSIGLSIGPTLMYSDNPDMSDPQARVKAQAVADNIKNLYPGCFPNLLGAAIKVREQEITHQGIDGLITEEGDQPNSKNKQDPSVNARSTARKAGAIAGALLYAGIGAVIGTFLIPIPGVGTTVGAIIGGLIGGAAGVVVGGGIGLGVAEGTIQVVDAIEESKQPAEKTSLFNRSACIMAQGLGGTVEDSQQDTQSTANSSTSELSAPDMQGHLSVEQEGSDEEKQIRYGLGGR